MVPHVLLENLERVGGKRDAWIFSPGPVILKEDGWIQIQIILIIIINYIQIFIIIFAFSSSFSFSFADFNF